MLRTDTLSVSLTSHNVVLNGMEPDSEPFGSGRPSIGYQS